MKKLFYRYLPVKLIFILAIFLLSSNVSLEAANSPDAVAFRVMPNSNHLSPLRWYKDNIKVQGSPQALTVDGYEAVRDGRTVYVNAANIDLKNGHCSNSKTTACTVSGSSCGVGNACVPNFYSNIYIISFNQEAENQTVDIFGLILANWKFNTNLKYCSNIPDRPCSTNGDCSGVSGGVCLKDKKDKVRRDTKRLADLADIKIALDNYQKAHNGDYPNLAAGSYVAGKSLSVWPTSWQATLGKELTVTLPVDPDNKLGACGGTGYDTKTCWNQALKKFAGIPNGSRTYVYTYNGAKSYNICALMESGYLTDLTQGACAGSAVGHGATCTPDNCATSTCKGQTCNNGCAIVAGQKNCDCPLPWGGTIKSGQSVTAYQKDSVACGSTCVWQTRACANDTLLPVGSTYTYQACRVQDCCSATCNAPNQPICRAPANAPANSEPGVGVCCGGEACYKCAANFTWNGAICAADTKTFTCAAKPTVGTEWNTASSYTQTWNGSAWSPADSITGHNEQADTNSCRFKCADNYSWDNIASACVRCGDGVKNGTEACDGTDGVGAHQSCSSACVLNNLTYCGDGTRQTPNGEGVNEVCDNALGSATFSDGCPATVTLPCGDVVVLGTKICNATCDGWRGCVGDIPASEDHTSSDCNSTNVSASDYACCQLTGCVQDGCACCGRGAAEIPASYTSVSTLDVIWQSGRTLDSCVGVSSCGGTTTECTGDSAPGDLRSNACRLNRSTQNNRDWLVATNHSTAYYKCWK